MEEPKDSDDEGRPAPPAPVKAASFWQDQIALAEKDHASFFKYGEKVEKRYRNEKDETTKGGVKKRLNILYSNTETAKASLYARAAQPDVRQRFTQTGDKLARTTAEILERNLKNTTEDSCYDRSYRKGIQDLCLPGRGVIRVNYEPEFGMDPQTGQEVLTEQEVEEEFVYYRDFLHSPAQCWEQVWWIAFRHKMTREDLRDNKFEDAENVPLNWMPDGYASKDKPCPDEMKRAEVWEVWDKTSKKRIWVVKGYSKLLRSDEDPYGLEEFFPCAEPIQAIFGNDSFVPSSWFVQYEDQANDLDEIVARISSLTRALKRRGVYNAGIKELKRLAKAADNEFIPAENWAEFAQGGGLKGNFDTEDISSISAVLLNLYQQKDQLMTAIYDIMGYSDILRGGATNPNETATAQALKSQNGSIRLKLAQRDVQRWIRDTLRIKAELMAEHYEAQALLDGSGMQLPTQAEVQAQLAQAQMQAMQTGQPFEPPQEMPVTIDDVIQVLRSDKLRSYRIDVETDSTVFEDAEAEKNARTELLTSMGGFLQQWLPVAQMGGPPMIKLGFDMLAFGVRGFKSGRQLEEALEEARTAIETQAAQPPEPPQPDPKLEAEKIKLEGVKAKTTAEVQKAQLGIMQTQEEHMGTMREKAMDAATNPYPPMRGYNA